MDATPRTALLDTIGAFRALGAEIVDVQFPDVRQAIADWVPNCAVQAAVAHETTHPTRKAEFGSDLASVIEAGRALSGIEYPKNPAAANAIARARRYRIQHFRSALDQSVTGCPQLPVHQTIGGLKPIP